MEVGRYKGWKKDRKKDGWKMKYKEREDEGIEDVGEVVMVGEG